MILAKNRTDLKEAVRHKETLTRSKRTSFDRCGTVGTTRSLFFLSGGKLLKEEGESIFTKLYIKMIVFTQIEDL